MACEGYRARAPCASASRCGEGGDQFHGYFEQQPSGDQDASERSVREAWAPYADDQVSAEVVRTDRPGGTMQVSLRREDGFLVLMTVTDSKTSVIATSDGHGAPVVPTDRPDGSTELLLQREDGLSLLLTVTEVMTSIIAASACFPGGIGPDPLEVLPESEPGVVQG